MVKMVIQLFSAAFAELTFPDLSCIFFFLLTLLSALPQILLSIFALLAICAGMAWGLTRFMHIDFMTAYLATSPGGLDTVAVIAAGSNADMALIMAMQTLRLFSILLTGPAIARFISTYAPKRSA